MTSLNNPVNLPLDTNGYVKSSIWAQNVLSHQTGLSATISTANAPVNIGSAISVANNGILFIAIAGHVNGGVGSIRISRTRNSVVDIINQDPLGDNSTTQGASLFTDGITLLADSEGIGSTTRQRLNKTLISTGVSISAPFGESPDVLIIEALSGDSLQFQVSNTVASDITYIDDLMVMQ